MPGIISHCLLLLLLLLLHSAIIETLPSLLPSAPAHPGDSFARLISCPSAVHQRSPERLDLLAISFDSAMKTTWARAGCFDTKCYTHDDSEHAVAVTDQGTPVDTLTGVPEQVYYGYASTHQ
jgi:hypothetical protein